MTSTAAETVLIRFATPDDEARLRAIDDATWSTRVTPAPRASQPGFFREGLDPADVLVAIADDEVVGFVLLGHPTPLPASAHVQMVRGLAVDPVCQGRGVGRALLEKAIAEATARGARRLTLRVLGGNETALRLYESCGFETEGVLRGEFVLGGREIDDVLMARGLPR